MAGNVCVCAVCSCHAQQSSPYGHIPDPETFPALPIPKAARAISGSKAGAMARRYASAHCSTSTVITYIFITALRLPHSPDYARGKHRLLCEQPHRLLEYEYASHEYTFPPSINRNRSRNRHLRCVPVCGFTSMLHMIGTVLQAHVSIKDKGGGTGLC